MLYSRATARSATIRGKQERMQDLSKKVLLYQCKLHIRCRPFGSDSGSGSPCDNGWWCTSIECSRRGTMGLSTGRWATDNNLPYEQQWNHNAGKQCAF